jgi:hypothetical protein
MNTTLENKNNLTSLEAHAALSEAIENRVANQLNAVKHEVFTEYQGVLGANDQLLRLALIEAESLAQQTEYPHLVFPLLASEKAHNAARWQFHQKYLLRSNSPYALAA